MSSPPPSHLLHPGLLTPRRGALGVCVLVAIAYAPVWEAGFIWDDDDYVTENATLDQPGGLYRIWFEIGAVPQYYPLVHTTFWLEHRLYGENPRGYHVVNVLLHGLAALLLWRVLRRVELPAAGWVAALFAVHPVGVESVAWVTERKNVLAGCFYGLTMLALLRFHNLAAEPAERRWRWYGAALVCFLGAVFSKTVAASLPAAFLLLVWWKRGCLRLRDGLELLPFFAIGIALGLLTASMETTRVGAVGNAWDHSSLDRVLIAGRAAWFYAGKVVWPLPLAFIYPRWTIDDTAPAQYLFPLAALLVIAALWWQRRRLGRGPLTAVLLVGGTLFPALGFFDVYPMRFSYVADHFQYLALPAALALLVSGAAKAVAARGPGSRNLVTGLGLIALIGFTGLSHRQSRVYRDLDTLWRDTIAKNPGGALAPYNLAQSLLERGEAAAALPLFAAASRNRPGDIAHRFKYATELEKAGRRAEAEAEFLAAIALTPDNRDSRVMHMKALINLGALYAKAGEISRAQPHFEQALRRTLQEVPAPSPHAMARLSLARIHASRGRGADAERLLREAVELCWTVATSPHAELRSGTEAVAIARAASSLKQPPSSRLLDVWAAGLAETGDFPGAVQMAERAVRRAGAEQDATAQRDIGERLRGYQQGRPFRTQR